MSRGSGNVFEDLDHPESTLAIAKAELARRIAETIERRDWTQTHVADVLGVDQARVSEVVTGRVRRVTIDRLFRFLVALGNDVEVTVKPRRAPSGGRLRVRSRRRK